MTQNQIAYLGVKESIRHNMASEAISSGGLDESVRHNLETESMNWFSAKNSARYQEASAQAAMAQAGASYARAAAAAASARAAQTGAAAQYYNALTNRMDLNGETALGAQRLREQTFKADTAQTTSQSSKLDFNIKKSNLGEYQNYFIQNWASPALTNAATKAKVEETNANVANIKQNTAYQANQTRWSTSKNLSEIWLNESQMLRNLTSTLGSFNQ